MEPPSAAEAQQADARRQPPSRAEAPSSEGAPRAGASDAGKPGEPQQGAPAHGSESADAGGSGNSRAGNSKGTAGGGSGQGSAQRVRPDGKPLGSPENARRQAESLLAAARESERKGDYGRAFEQAVEAWQLTAPHADQASQDVAARALDDSRRYGERAPPRDFSNSRKPMLVE